jgi:hypothetical protein
MTPRPGSVLQRRLRELEWSQYRLRQELNARGEAVPTGLICRWVDGSRVPDLTRALLLEELVGIDPRIWARPSARSKSS